jgi:hypothetical protein
MMVTLLDKIINQARVVEAFSRTKDRDSWLEARQQLENLKGELLVTIARLKGEEERLINQVYAVIPDEDQDGMAWEDQCEIMVKLNEGLEAQVESLRDENNNLRWAEEENVALRAQVESLTAELEAAKPEGGE